MPGLYEQRDARAQREHADAQALHLQQLLLRVLDAQAQEARERVHEQIAVAGARSGREQLLRPRVCELCQRRKERCEVLPVDARARCRALHAAENTHEHPQYVAGGGTGAQAQVHERVLHHALCDQRELLDGARPQHRVVHRAAASRVEVGGGGLCALLHHAHEPGHEPPVHAVPVQNDAYRGKNGAGVLRVEPVVEHDEHLQRARK